MSDPPPSGLRHRDVDAALRRALPGITRVVCAYLRRQRVTFNVYDDAIAEGMIAAWCSLPALPDGVDLARFAAKPIRRRVRRLIAERGHAVSLPEETTARRAEDHLHARRHARSLDQPAAEGALPRVAMLRGEPYDVETAIDVRAALARVSPRDREVLMRDALGEMQTEIGESMGVTNESARKWLRAAENNVRKKALNPFRRAA